MITKPKIPIDLKEVERLASLGISQEKIAFHLNISEATLYKRKRECQEFKEAIARGRVRTEIKAADYLQKLIDEGDRHAIIFYLKTQCGWRETVSNDIKAEVKAEVATNFDVTKMSDEELAKLATILTNQQTE